MSYKSIGDIVPVLLAATQNGRLMWESSKDDTEFTTSVNGNKIEVDFGFLEEIEEEKGTERTTISIFLWSESGKIIDSYHFKKDLEGYAYALSFFYIIKKSTSRVAFVLEDIVKTLQEKNDL